MEFFVGKIYHDLVFSLNHFLSLTSFELAFFVARKKSGKNWEQKLRDVITFLLTILNHFKAQRLKDVLDFGRPASQDNLHLKIVEAKNCSNTTTVEGP